MSSRSSTRSPNALKGSAMPTNGIWSSRPELPRAQSTANRHGTRGERSGARSRSRVAAGSRDSQGESGHAHGHRHLSGHDQQRLREEPRASWRQRHWHGRTATRRHRETLDLAEDRSPVHFANRAAVDNAGARAAEAQLAGGAGSRPVAWRQCQAIFLEWPRWPNCRRHSRRW